MRHQPKRRPPPLSIKSVVVAGCLLAAGPCVPSFAGPAADAISAQSVTRLPGHVPALAAVSQMQGRLAPTMTLPLALSLPLRNEADLDALIARLHDPSSPDFGQYLTPEQFAGKYAPTQAQYSKAIEFARSHGFTVVGTQPNRTLLTVSAPVGKIESAFGVHLNQYQAPDGRVFHAPNAEPTVSRQYAGAFAGVVGLNSARVYKPLLVRKSLPSIASKGAAVEQGTGPFGGLIPSDIKTAYDLDGVALDGKGQTLAVFELDSGYSPRDVLRYERYTGSRVVPIENVPVDGGVGVIGGNSAEIVLDIDMDVAMAPGATKILVYDAPYNNGVGFVDELNKMATDNRAKAMSLSYGGDEGFGQPDLMQYAENNAFKQMAAQGQSIYVSSGDKGSENEYNVDPVTGAPLYEVSVSDPASCPYACGVGGTEITVQGAGYDEHYASETTWNVDGTPAGGAGGGGVSKIWRIPSYQTAAAASASPLANVSATHRNVPDVSLNSSQNTGYTIYLSTVGTPGFTIYGGTSAAAPLWAGFTALVNQNRALHGQPPLGFPNLSLYPLLQSPDYESLFHDIQDGSSNSTDGGPDTTGGITSFAAEPGFDDSTGLGTFDGANLLAALSGAYPTKPGVAFGVGRSTRNGPMGHLAQYLLPSTVRFTASLRSHS